MRSRMRTARRSGVAVGVAEFFDEGRGWVEVQAPAGFAAAHLHALGGGFGFGFGFGAFGGHPQLQGERGELGLLGFQCAAVFERPGRVGQEVVEFGVLALLFALQAHVVIG